MNFLGEEPAWEKAQLLDRVSTPNQPHDASEAS